MTAGNKTSLPREVHLNIKHDVASNLLKANELGRFTFPYLLWGMSIVGCPCDLEFGHFLIDCLFPKIRIRDSIDLQCFFDRFW
jgi:hypothetical protein